MTCETDLSCPQPGNFAAIAKQLHQTAVQAEERIYCQEQLIRASLNRPTAISRKTIDSDSYVASTEAVIFDEWNGGDYTPIFSNSSMQIFQGMRYPAGVYQIGLSLDPYATGVITPDSQRVAIIEVRKDMETFPSKRVQQSLFETDTGLGSLLGVECTERVEEGDLIIFKFFHNNASLMRMNTVMTQAWVHKISDVDVARVL